MAFQFILKLIYLGAESMYSVMVADDGTVDEYRNGELSGHEKSFEDWAHSRSETYDLPTLVPEERRHKLNNVEVVWDNTDPTHLKVGDQVFTVQLKARITDTPQQSVRRGRAKPDNPAQGRLFKEGA